MSDLVELTIATIGARGDGIAHDGGGPVYIPFTVPGDRVRARIEDARGTGRAAVVAETITPGPGRATPPCRHFGTCGGCALQHLDPALYAETKTEFVRAALAHHGLVDAPLRPLILLPPGTRRRVRLSLARPARKEAATIVGFSQRASHDLVAIDECAVLAPKLFALVAPLRVLAGGLLAPGESGHATLQLADSGADALLDLPRAPDLAALETLAAFAEAQDVARLLWRTPQAGKSGGEPMLVAQRRPVRIVIAGTAIDLPPDAFLQATPEAEAALTEAVREAVGPAVRIADLFAGIGTFAFALAGVSRVDAVEGWAPAAEAINRAARRGGIAGRVTAQARDLQRRPLEPDELAPYDAIVLDPPRIGAKAQAAALARSGVPRIAAVSCNPASFARDARILIAGGYRLAAIQPIDQFVWSPHVELVAAFVHSAAG
jgi:23S rRNA (uracil1939-C5)-methyltransferase